MKSRVSQAIFAFTVFFSQALVGVHAFTLGDLRGSAVIGRGLDVSVVVQTGEGEEANAACIRAEVFHADVPIAAPRVSVTPGRDGGGQSLVRIESAVSVDEPVVTVLVRANCGSATQRRYVLLADFPVVPDVPAVVTSAIAVGNRRAAGASACRNNLPQRFRHVSPRAFCKFSAICQTNPGRQSQAAQKSGTRKPGQHFSR